MHARTSDSIYFIKENLTQIQQVCDGDLRTNIQPGGRYFNLTFLQAVIHHPGAAEQLDYSSFIASKGFIVLAFKVEYAAVRIIIIIRANVTVRKTITPDSIR